MLPTPCRIEFGCRGGRSATASRPHRAPSSSFASPSKGGAGPGNARREKSAHRVRSQVLRRQPPQAGQRSRWPSSTSFTKLTEIGGGALRAALATSSIPIASIFFTSLDVSSHIPSTASNFSAAGFAAASRKSANGPS